MNAPPARRMDRSHFIAWAETQERRYELVDGRVSLLPYVTRNHWRITTNLVVALSARLDRTAFDVGTGDFAVQTGDQRVRYADVMVTPFTTDGAERSTEDAILLAEITSPSTTHIDFGAKLAEYQGLATLSSYLICAQDAVRVWCWTRGEQAWPPEPTIVEGRDEQIAIPALGLVLPLAEIYANVSLP